MTDLRIYCSDNYKKLVKITAIQKGLSVSDFLMGIISTAIPEESDGLVFITQDIGTTTTEISCLSPEVLSAKKRGKEGIYE